MLCYTVTYILGIGTKTSSGEYQLDQENNTRSPVTRDTKGNQGGCTVEGEQSDRKDIRN